MGSKYIIVPKDAELRNEDAQKPEEILDTVSFARAMKIVIKQLVSQQQIDVLDASNLIATTEATPIGGVLEVDDAIYNSLLGEFKRPRALNGVLYGLGGGLHQIVAVMEAKSQRPKPTEVAEPVAN